MRRGMLEKPRQQSGAALVMVLLGIFILTAVGAFIILGVDRNAELRFAYQRSVAGFGAAEAGIHVGAVAVQNAMQNFGLPTNCNPQALLINGRTVTYTLSVPTGPPWNGTAGSCTETPKAITETAGSPFAGMNASLYTYNLTSSAKNALGFVEAQVSNQFNAHLIPMFSFGAFYAQDLEYTPGPTSVFNGRVHTNGDLYLNSADCGSAISDGLNLLGQITIVGSGVSGTAPLNRGFKSFDHNSHNVYISLDGTSSNMQVLGSNAAGSASCALTSNRQIPQSEINTFNTGGQTRITTGIQNLTLPTPPSVLCVPWITSCTTSSTYWQNANLRVVLDTTTTKQLVTGPVGPALYPVNVLQADGSVDSAKTTQLQTFMKNVPGAITYSDVPLASSNWNCSSVSTCESSAYSVSNKYSTPFPVLGTGGCLLTRGPRSQINVNGTNYCYDYRYGGFYNWREGKPILMLNIDWMALEEWNRNNGNVLFDSTTTVNGGPVIFVSVKDTTSTEGYKATNYGVRLYDAGRARRGSADVGVAFATDQALYLTGNVNCPTPNYAGSDSSPATCGDATWPPPTGASTKQKPVAVIADTINVLSCNWIVATSGSACGTFTMDADQWSTVCGNVSGGCRPVDEASTLTSGTSGSGATCSSGSGCLAKETIINAGFLAGNDRTWCSSNSNGTLCGYPTYDSGGLQNYPRFHEDWTGTDAGTGRVRKYWYQGSYVAIGVPYHTCFEYTAQLVAGLTVANDPAFPCGAVPQGFWSNQRYGAPPRRWFYDTSFNDGSRLPPLTPRFVYLSQVYFTELFK